MEAFKEMQGILTFIATIGGILALIVYLYESLTTPQQKRNHRRIVKIYFKRLQRIRSLELAQNDARMLLRWINWLYQPKLSENSFTFRSKSVWLWRPLFMSLIIAFIYIIPLLFITVIKINNAMIQLRPEMAEIIRSNSYLYIFRNTLIFVPINALLDLISINITRKLLSKMIVSTSTKLLIFLLLLDIFIAGLLYITGPLWTILEYVIGPQFIDLFWYRIGRTIPLFLTCIKLVFEPIQNIKSIFDPNTLSGEAVFINMFLTTIIPTMLHLLITVFFFGSKIFAEPLRKVFEVVIGYMSELPTGITALFAILCTSILVILVWIIAIFM